MKKAFHNIISIAMAFLVLFSTSSFTVDKHFCGSMLMDIAIFSEAESCGMEMHEHSDTTEGFVDLDFCCENQKIAIEGQDELKASYNSLNFDQQLFLATFTYSYIHLFEGLPIEAASYKDYTPPLLVTDIQVLDQVFLI
ncbi:hypothetical protein FHG64_12995 [Antarcticibacterium flavum]|uniref:Secreted protein n=1 Tax=Antarcticibacterium flavum TaxID=2058175 RepID=A0A5B7X573_9FLAO|nr:MULTISPECIES: hypothetical protein [Antarcticibacterium]MCM4158494.1 hypothetical protein [Antarcticibacterium sp. W02-3]QCY70245.1 hypothetical protein FHG64_12995 [Antarcticibacterium flavum]